MSVPGLLAACALLSATPQVTSGAPSSSSASDLRTFDEGGLTFAYPGAWQELHFTVDSSFSHLIAVLATVPVPNPCATTVTASFTEIDCAAHFQLVPDSVVIEVQEGGMPGFDISHVPDGASPMTVDGQPAYLRDTSGRALTTDEPAVGADLVRTWTLSNPGAPDNYFEIDAFIRGPNIGSIEETLASLVASLRYDPPATPGPTPAAASPGADAVTPPVQVSPSPPASTGIKLTCLGPDGISASPLASCAEEEAAVLEAVARLGYPAQSVAVGLFDFRCGGPFAAGVRSCPAMLAPNGGAAYVTFVGTPKVAAVTFTAPDDPPLTATVWVFEVPPSGWSMP